MVDIAFVPTLGGVIFGRGKKGLLSKLAPLRPLDAVLRPVFIAPSAWAISTAYIKGEAVANGGNWYVCTTAGTSAGSGGPTGTGTAMITDSTVKWQFLCVARALTTLDPSSIAKATAVLGDLVTAVNLGGGGYARRFGMPPALAVTESGAGGQVPQSTLPKNASFEIGAGQWESYTDVPRFSWRSCYCEALRIIVDGVTVTPGNYNTANATGNAYTALDFNGVRKDRLIQIIGSQK